MARNVQILIVDDSNERRVALRKQLALAGLAVVGEASLGQEAFSLAKELRPDIILVNVEEPLARPLQVIEQLSLAMPLSSVVAVSNEGRGDVIRKAMLVGAREFLVKPFTDAEIREAIYNVLEVEEKRRQAQGIAVQSVIDTVPQATVVTIFGAKGGIGKTTIAVNLAVGIATQLHMKVALVDLDVQFGGAAVMLDVVPQKDISDLIDSFDLVNEETLPAYITAHPSGLALLAAPLRPFEAVHMTKEQVERVISLLARKYDYVIIDTPPFLNEGIFQAFEMSTLVFVLTTLEIPCIKNTKQCLEFIRERQFSHDKVKLMVSQANASNTVGKGDLEGTLNYQVFWKIPFDTECATAAQIGKPLIQVNPKAKAAQSITDLLAALSGVKKTESGGFLRRLWGS